MNRPSSAVDAAIRALHGEADPESVRAALGDWSLACVLALASSVDPAISATAAAAGQLTALLDAPTIADPAVHYAIRTMIGTKEGWAVFRSWAKVAPAGWGADIADDLIAAVHHDTCHPADAAALIGPCDESADLLDDPQDIAFAICRWGKTDPNRPTAWTTHVSEGERERLMDALQTKRSRFCACLPWLPPTKFATDAAATLDIGYALEAFADAPPIVRAQHADLLDQLITAATPWNLGDLTRLACAVRSDIVWQRIQALLQVAPDRARLIVAIAPWESLPEHVQTIILNAADDSNDCAAIAAAQGRRATAFAHGTAVAFFATLRPDIWNAHDAATQRQWLDALGHPNMHFAVRSLGPRPEILAHAKIDNDLIIATQRHAPDNAALRDALLPVALYAPPVDPIMRLSLGLRATPVADASRVIAALPSMPPDPGAFFCIASGCGDPNVIAPAAAMLHTPADLAVAVTLQRVANGGLRVCDACMAMQDALRGRSWNDVTTILSLLDNDARALLTPDRNTLARRLSRARRRAATRQALDAIAALPLEVAAPACYALERWDASRSEDDAQDAADGVAFSLRAHGDCFLALIDALSDGDNHRVALLPPPNDPMLANALHALTCDDPVIGRNLARALLQQAWDAASATLLDMPRAHADAIVTSLTEDTRTALLSVAETHALSLAAEERTDDLRTAWRRMVSDVPLSALALAALAADDPDERTHGVAALADYPQITRALLPLLRPDIQNLLRDHPAIAAALADLSDEDERSSPSMRSMLRRI